MPFAKRAFPAIPYVPYRREPLNHARKKAHKLSSQQQGTEFVHLPGIVESAESSPNAAREAAHRIRRILSDTAAVPPANTQYNAIMLIRILVDNPGHTFTRNIDAKFVAAVKDLLRQGKDPNVQHFLRDTLDSFDTQRSWDEDLSLLLQMWRKEKTKLTRTNSGVRSSVDKAGRQTADRQR